MSVWAIVPVKPFNRAKSRLAGILTPDEREDLSRAFLRRTLEILAPVAEIERTLVVSRDSAALALARELGAQTVTEAGTPNLNRALLRASQLAQSFGVEAVLILPADLPFLSVEDVRQLIAAGSEPAMRIAPDRHEDGTNALFVRPPSLLEYGFGPRSFKRHLARAKELGAQVSICHPAGVALDVDVPEDFELYRAHRAVGR